MAAISTKASTPRQRWSDPPAADDGFFPPGVEIVTHIQLAHVYLIGKSAADS